VHWRLVGSGGEGKLLSSGMSKLADDLPLEFYNPVTRTLLPVGWANLFYIRDMIRRNLCLARKKWLKEW